MKKVPEHPREGVLETGVIARFLGQGDRLAEGGHGQVVVAETGVQCCQVQSCISGSSYIFLFLITEMGQGQNFG